MRYPRPRRKQVRSETIIMTGGLNEVVTNLELKKGELHQCVNYMEMDGDYNGYSSILGYEVYDGKGLASEVGAVQITDEGNDDNTTLLIESPDFEDISNSQHQIVNNSTTIDSLIYKFEESSFYFVGTNTIQIESQDAGAFVSGFTNGFDQEVTGTNSYLNLDQNWTIDLQIKPKASISTQVIFQKDNSYKLEIDSNGKLAFYISSTGTSWDYSLVMTEETITNALFSHISIACKSNVIRIAVNGVPIEDGVGAVKTVTIPGINADVSNLIIGTSYTGWLDEFRISNIYRWITNFDAPVERYSTIGYDAINWDDVDRETQRALITEVPGTGNLLGCHIYGGELYALRNVDGVNAALYRANETGDDLTAGWVLVDNTLTANGSLKAVNYRWSGVFSSKEVMIIVDGVSLPRIWDGTTMTLYDNAEAANLPDRDVSPRFAKNVAIFDKRVLFAYEEDDITLSSKSDPRDYTLGFGSQLIIGDDINDLRELPGENMAIICRNSVKILEKLEIPTSTASTPDYTFRVRDFSRQAGGLANSCQRILQHILYADDRGIISMNDSDTYGDFAAKAVSKKVNKIYLEKRNLITTSIVDKERNQYRIFFSDNTGLIFTFKEDGLKGATFISYGTPVLHCTEGEDKNGNIVKYFTTNNGYVYRMDSGTSFNGDAIDTEMFTSFYHYKTARQWKQFLRVVFEISASRGTVFGVRSVFDYNSEDFPESLWWEPLVKGLGGNWDEDNWNQFVYGGAVIQRMTNYIRGHGTNMSLELVTNSKYNSQHTIHNAIVDYTVEDKQI